MSSGPSPILWTALAVALLGCASANTTYEARVVTAARTETLGPEAAKGAVLYLPGYRGRLARADLTVVPPYVREMNKDGWDVYRFNSAEGAGRRAAVVYPALVRAAQEIRADGYREVVGAGQSAGAWLLLMAARDPTLFERVAAAVPANSGAGTSAGPSSSWGAWKERNATELYPIVREIRQTPTAVIFFEGDPFEPQPVERPGRIIEILRNNSTPNLVLDRPAGFRGHSAAWHTTFDYYYGACLRGFLRGVMPDLLPDLYDVHCVLPPSDRSDHRAIADEQGLEDSPAQRLERQRSPPASPAERWSARTSTVSASA